jgi:anthranilate synthase/aminodeoxychorismate synthase-like glutamine amidotransferase
VVFVLDNYDSFTYNLVQYLGELGAEVEVRRNDQISVSEIEAMRPERILISPGPCTPQEAGISIDLIRHFTGKVPLLGVCLGHQALGAAFGGQVVRAKNLMHGKTSQVEHRHPLPLADRRRRRTTERIGSQCLDLRQRRNPSHHGIAAQEISCRGSAVSSRECADG